MANPAPGFKNNPSKEITIVPQKGTVTVKAGDVVIARSQNAKLLSEAPYPGRIYIPFADIKFEHLSKTSHSTHCPYKGDASYWSAAAAGERGTNAMWAYETPFDEVAEIKDHGAFYADRVTIEVA